MLKLVVALLVAMSAPAFAFPADVVTGFSKTKTAQTAVINALDGTKVTAYLAIYALTDPAIIDAIIRAKDRGVDVRVKYDLFQAHQATMITALSRLNTAHIVSTPIRMSSRAAMHHKFVVLDGVTTLTGSFNWTKNATQNNYENLVVISSPEIANLYMAEWNRIKTYTPKPKE